MSILKNDPVFEFKEGDYSKPRHIIVERWHSPSLTHQCSLPLTLWFTPDSGGGVLEKEGQVGWWSERLVKAVT